MEIQSCVTHSWAWDISLPRKEQKTDRKENERDPCRVLRVLWQVITRNRKTKSHSHGSIVLFVSFFVVVVFFSSHGLLS